MSAAMCGKRCYFEEEWESLPLVIAKKLRPTPSQLDRLMEVFPNIHKQLLEKALQENDNDFDSVIKSFNQLCLGHVDENSGLSNEAATSEEYAENSSAHGNIPVTNCLQQKNEALMRENMALKEQQQQTESLMKEQQQQTEALMKEQQQQIEALMRGKKEQQQQTEALMKEQQQQIEALMREIVALKGQVTILKRGVLSKHERQKYLEKEVSTLQVKIYALTMPQAQEGNSMPGWCHPDVC